MKSQETLQASFPTWPPPSRRKKLVVDRPCPKTSSAPRRHIWDMLRKRRICPFGSEVERLLSEQERHVKAADHVHDSAAAGTTRGRRTGGGGLSTGATAQGAGASWEPGRPQGLSEGQGD